MSGTRPYSFMRATDRSSAARRWVHCDQDVTESWWPDEESFRASWNDPAEQARLVPAVSHIADALFLVSEELQTYAAPE